MFVILAPIVGGFIGLFVWSQIVFPIGYGLPRSIAEFRRGQLRAAAIVMQLAPPVLWLLVVPVVLGFLLGWLFPSAVPIVLQRSLFWTGFWAALPMIVFYGFGTRKGHDLLRRDFDRTTATRFARAEQAPPMPRSDREEIEERVRDLFSGR